MPEAALPPTTNAKNLHPLIVAISGASGAVYAIALLSFLRQAKVSAHLIISRAAELTIAQETDLALDDLRAMADVVYDSADIAAPPASGSFRTRGMIVAPCSVRSMSEIASGVTSSLLTRAADVTLKERRRLVLMVRETPLHAGHLKTMLALTEMGAIVAPPAPSFYTRPASLEDMVLQSAARMLDLFSIEVESIKRWGG